METEKSRDSNSGFMSAGEAATFLKLSRGTIHNLVWQGKIPFYKPSGKLLFKRAELEAWIARTAGGPARQK